MRITIDYTPALRQGAGIGRYTAGLVAGLAELESCNRFTLFCAGEANPPALPAGFVVRSIRIPWRWLTIGWYRLGLPLPAEALCGPCDLYHSTDYTLPPLRSARGVVTVHDLSFLRVPHCADPGLRKFLERNVPRSVRRAGRVLADSRSTACDLTALLGVAPAKISVVYAGVEDRFARVEDPARLGAVRKRYALPERFVLSVGTLEPRKNYPRLISAFASARRRGGLDHHLVIAGKPGWLYDETYRQVDKESLIGQVHFLGFVADSDLPALYSLADLFVFPSLYEGFGIPPLEAMACGVPVVCSDNSSLPEAVGAAALLVNALDTGELAGAIGRALGDSQLRAQLSALGPGQAARFTWKAAATQLLDAYQLAFNDRDALPCAE